MMSDHAVPELTQPPRTKHGSRAVVVVIAVVAIAGVAWYLRSRHHERTVAESAARAPGGAGDGSGAGGRGGGSGAEARVVPVQVAVAERKDLPIWLEGLGTIAAVQQVTVRPQVDGKIDKVLFVEGQPVRKGDVLMQIDPRPLMVALHQAQGALARDKAQLETLQANLKRYQGLKAENLVAGQQVEDIAGQVGQFEGSIKIDQATIENALLQLDYAQVKAPIDGITGVRQVDAGNLIHQTDANGIVVITAVDPAAVFFTVPQDQLSAVAQALARGEVPVDVYSRDGATKLASGKLAVLDNQVNQTTATLRLKALVANPNRLLWPNAFVKAQMLVETRKNAVVVPTVAIQRGPQGTYVYAVGADRTAQMKPVTVALTTGEQAVIEKGLEGGEQVIIEGQNQVRPGGRVEPTNPNGAAPGAAGPAAAGGKPGQGSGSGRNRHGAGSGAGMAGSAVGARPAPGAAPPAGAPQAEAGSAAPSNAQPGVGSGRPRDPAAGPTASTQTPATP